MNVTSSPAYSILAEQFKPHIRAATVQQYSLVMGGKIPSSKEVEHITEVVMKAMKLEIERASDLKQEPNIAVPVIVGMIKAAIAREIQVKPHDPSGHTS